MRKKTLVTPLHRQVLSPQPSKTDVRRALILDAVLKILSRDGVDELTFERVGTEAGMARSHVVYYFKDRNELVMSGLRFAAASAGEIIEAHVAGGSDWKDSILRYVEANFRWIEDHPEHATVYVLLYYLARLQRPYRLLHTEIREAGTARVMGLLEKGPLKGQKKKALALAKCIQGLITGNLIDALTTESGAVDIRRRETLQAVEAWIA